MDIDIICGDKVRYIKPEDIMPDNDDTYKGHRKGTTSAFFLNVEYALFVIPKNEYEKTCNCCGKMMRYQMYDVVKSNSHTYNFIDNKLKKIFHEEMNKYKTINKKREICFNNNEMRGLLEMIFTTK